MAQRFIIKLCGLPWSTQPKEVYKFLKDCAILNEEQGIHLTQNPDGRPSGDCFVELASQADVEKAKIHSNELIGKRYIVISDAKRAEFEWYVNGTVPGAGAYGSGAYGSGAYGAMGGNDDETFVKLRGLPFEATKAEVAEFFTGIEIAPYGITITMNQDGRPSGEAYVQFTSASAVDRALLKNKEKIGTRWIEIFKCSKHDVKYVAQAQSNMYAGGFAQPMGYRPGPYDRPGGMAFSGRGGGRGGGGGGMNMGGMNMGMSMRGGNFSGRSSRGTGGPIRGGKKPSAGKGEANNSVTGHMVHMRGIPFGATQGDVYRFLAPLIPAEVRMLTEKKGQAEVDFDTHSDALTAMSKDKMNMGNRYIELFLKSEPSANEGWSNNNMYSQMGNQDNSWQQMWW